MFICTFANKVAYYTDTTFTKVLPGLALDAVASLRGPSSPKTFQNLVKWGAANGRKELKDVKKLHYSRRFFYPLEYVTTSFITSARRTYYYAAMQNINRKSVNTLSKDIRRLAKKHLRAREEDDGISLDTLETGVREVLKEAQKTTSVWNRVRNLYNTYPNTRVRHYAAWAIRWGFFYYMTPTSSRLVNAAITTSIIFGWTSLLVPTARKELEKLEGPQAKGQHVLPSNAQANILAKATSAFPDTSMRNFKEALGKLQVQDSIDDPFATIKNAAHWEQEYLRLKQGRESKAEGSSSWYKKDWQMRTAMINYYDWKSKDVEKAGQERSRKKYWEKWYEKDADGAEGFLEKQTDVPEDIYSQWLTGGSSASGLLDTD